MIQFILNEKQVSTDLPSGLTLLDFIRYHQQLLGTKIGCREGDCGACTVLVGEIINDNLNYRSMTSCLVPLGNVNGKHIVTVEGLNFPGLNPVQQAMSDEGASQCGFCTPGFVVSLAGFCMQNKNNDARSFIDGNICRCTGYKSIERAAQNISLLLEERKEIDPVEFAVSKKIIPEYFLLIKERIKKINSNQNNKKTIAENSTVFIGGGTDLYVQKHEEMVHASAEYISEWDGMKTIRQERDQCILGGAVTVSDLLESPLINEIFPEFEKYSKLVSSTPIRNMATLGGNFVNASPIGDFTVFFLALDAVIKLDDGKNTRTLPLRKFYRGYKDLDKKKKEFVREISFTIPGNNTQFNFEKVSKRTNLDIASVNSAIRLSVSGIDIISAEISAGGVSPVPMFLQKTSDYLKGKELSEEVIDSACAIAGEEISPISDARGSSTYKRFLLQQLIRAHFIKIFPSIRTDKFKIVYEEY